MSRGQRVNVATLLMPLANTEYKYEFPHDVERYRVQLRDSSKTLHLSSQPGAVGVSYLITASALTIGTTVQNVANGACTVAVGGVRATIAVVPAGTPLSGDQVPQNKYGAWAIDVTEADAKSITPATANATGYDTAADAIAGIDPVAKDKARLGVITAINTAAVFIPGTTALNAAGVTDTYTDAILKDETDYPYMTLFAGGVLNEDDIFFTEENVDKTLYFSVITADQILEIMYWTGRRRGH